MTYVEPLRRRVRGLVGGVTVVDSEAVLLVHRPDLPPAYAFPDADVAIDAKAPLNGVGGYVTVGWDAVDTWMEEDEPVVMHPRNPYHRVDCRRSERWLTVEAGGAVVVDTNRTVAVYETSLEPRLYISPELIKDARLERSPTVTYCRYKGHASYWNLIAGEMVVADAAWSYDQPLSESAPIARLVSFDETRVSVLNDLPDGIVLTR